MELAFTDSEALVRDSVAKLLAQEVDSAKVRELQESGQHDSGLWQRLVESGWLGLAVPEALGGGGGSLVEVAIVVEQLARHAALVPYADAMAATAVVLKHGGDRVTDLVRDVASGQQLVLPAVVGNNDSFHVLPPGPNDAGLLDGDRYFVDFAPAATAFLVAGQASESRGTALVQASPGAVSVHRLFNVARIPSWRVAFDQAPATPAGGHQSYVDLLHLGRALASVECLGHAEAALAMTVDYVERRVQFGRPLGTFQAVRHHCANMAIFTSAMRFLVYEAVWALGQGVGTAEQVAIAKAWAGRAAVEVAQTAHQLHGGFGVTEEYDLHFHTLRAKYRSISWGTPTECLATVAAGVDQPRGWL